MLLSFFINIISLGSPCYVLRNSIITLIHRVRSLCYCTLRSKLFRVVSEQIKTEERDFRFWQRQKSKTAQKRLLRRLMILPSFDITFTVWKACATGFHPPAKRAVSLSLAEPTFHTFPYKSVISLAGSPSFCVGGVTPSVKPASRLIRAGPAANFFLTHASEPARRLYLAGYKSEKARAPAVVSGKRVIFFLIYTHTKVDLAIRVTLFPGIISIHI